MGKTSVGREFNLPRTLAIAGVLALHVAVGLVLIRPVSPRRWHRRGHGGSVSHALQLRFVRVSLPVTRAHDAGRRTSRVASQAPAHRPPATTSASPSNTTAKAEPAGKTLDLSLPASMHDRRGSRGPARIGRDLTAGRHRAPPRLPGHGHVHGAPRLHLTDPRQQGVAGMIRGIQGLLGVVDSHCVDVDTWRGMSREERFRHHVSQARIKRVARRHGCRRRTSKPPPRHAPGLIPRR